MRITTKTKLCSALLGCLVALTGAVGPAQAANWNIQVARVNSTTANVSWEVDLNKEYTVCMKLDSAGGDVCGTGSFTVTPTLNSSGYFMQNSKHHMMVVLYPPNCGQDYKVRIKRNIITYDTKVFRLAC